MHTVSLPQYAIERGRVMHPLKMLDSARTAVLAIDFQRFFIDADQPMGNVHARDMLATANRVHASVRNKGGLVTNGCCDCTARDGFQYGFNMVVAADATAAMTDEEHNAALLNLEIYYARVLDAEGIAAILA